MGPYIHISTTYVELPRNGVSSNPSQKTQSSYCYEDIVHSRTAPIKSDTAKYAIISKLAGRILDTRTIIGDKTKTNPIYAVDTQIIEQINKRIEILQTPPRPKRKGWHYT
jgi:hypothetical protein